MTVLVQIPSAECSTARLVAGYCWPWSGPNPGGTLAPEVVVADWAAPWNANADARRLAPAIPRSDFRASNPGGVDQVGCVYAAQGLEFDYVGVIFGPDLVYRQTDGGWVGQPAESRDRIVGRGVTDADLTAPVTSYSSGEAGK
jgi:uncharacterized protein